MEEVKKRHIAEKILVTIGVLLLIGAMVLFAAPYATYFHRFLAKAMVFGGIGFALVGGLMFMWRK